MDELALGGILTTMTDVDVRDALTDAIQARAKTAVGGHGDELCSGVLDAVRQVCRVGLNGATYVDGSKVRGAEVVETVENRKRGSRNRRGERLVKTL